MTHTVTEGDLYRALTVFGRQFELRYGYYDETDRRGKYAEPVPIYPDFQSSPQYDGEGRPFVMAMQDACPHYAGRDLESGCQSCRHYRRGEELIGLCSCPRNKKERNEI